MRPPQGGAHSTRVPGLATRCGHNPYAELTSGAAWYGADSLLTERYDRDNLGRITRIVETTAAGTTDRGYTYDERGRLANVRDSLAHTTLASYAYDANGNRTIAVDGGTSRTGTYDDQDRLTALDSTSYTYTASGERQIRTRAGATVSTTYDLLGNLVKVKLASGDSVEYVVDGRNRRVGRKFNGTLTARWLYGNDLNVVGELDTAGVLTKRFVYASSSHVPDLMVVRNPSGPDSTYRLVTDHLGSVRLVVNANTGFVVQRINYDAWGVATLDTQSGFTPFGYAGGLYDPATSLVRFGARDYDASAGVWTSKDPMSFWVGDANLYSYASSEPIDQVDPTGLDYWIEGPSVGTLPDGRVIQEVVGHTSINVGDPGGAYESYSFGTVKGLSGAMPFAILGVARGAPYPDPIKMGNIVPGTYMHTSSLEDRAIRNYLNGYNSPQQGSARYSVWNHSCREFTYERFEAIRQQGFGTLAPSPRPGNPELPSYAAPSGPARRSSGGR